jgi:hypothetical protein
MLSILSKVFLWGSLLFGLISIISTFILIHLLKKWEFRRVDEVQPNLSKFFLWILVVDVLCGALGIIGRVFSD